MNTIDIRSGYTYRFKSGLRRVTRVYGYRSHAVVEWQPVPPDNFERSVGLSQFAMRAIEIVKDGED